MNTFFVGIQGDMVTVMLPVPRIMTPSDALNLAANLAAMAEIANKGTESFQDVLDKVLNS